MKLLIGGSPCTHWKPVNGYEGIYEVSDLGDIRNVVTGRALKPKIERNGYVRIHLIKTTQHNFPDTIQMGDAFQVREEGWSVPEQ